jgi:hypothetical protein
MEKLIVRILFETIHLSIKGALMMAFFWILQDLIARTG